MKTFYRGKNQTFVKNNIKSSKLYHNIEQYKSSNNNSNPTIYQSIFNQNQYQDFNNNTSNNQNQNNYNNNNKTNTTIPLSKLVNIPKSHTNIIPNTYLNPSHMKFNKGTKKIFNKFPSRSHEKINENNDMNIINNNSNINNYKNNININLKKSVEYKQIIINNNIDEIPKKKMGTSQMNFYTKNNMNLFPNIKNNSINNNINNNLKEKENLFSINSGWMIFNEMNIYNDFIKQNMNKENYKKKLDFQYRRKEEKLKKGQNQLILERLQKKYESQNKAQNMHRTGTGFYQKNKKGNKRQYSALENSNNDLINKNNENNKKETKSEFSKKNSVNSINTIDRKIQIDANNSIQNDTKFNKTYNNGFNVKKFNKERKKKEKIIFTKIFKHFKKRTKANYFWVKYFNKKIKLKSKEEENENNFFTFKKKIISKSYDKNDIIFPKIFKKILRKNVIFKKNRKLILKREKIRYNTDNSEINEIKEYKRQQRKIKSKKSEYYSHYIHINNNNKKEKIELDSNSESDNSFYKKNEPQFRGIFDKDYNNNTNTNDIKNNKETKDNKDQRNFTFRTTSNFFSKNNNNKENTKEKNTNKNSEANKEKKEQKEKFNIENIINNVIENNKKAAAARSSTSFYNIGSNFMNNRMRSTKTNFFSAKENKGGNFTGTKDSNFTKEQANEGRYYKPNSLKLTLINPLGWRKHEEIWSNLVSLKLGLNDLEKYLHPPNDTDVLVSSYLKMNPKVINFCSIQKINTSKTNIENNNFISFMIDDNIQNPKQEIKKWKEAYKRVIFRWHPDKLFATLEEINFKNEQQKVELKKKSTQIINNMNTLYRNIIEILNKIAENKNDKEGIS